MRITKKTIRDAKVRLMAALQNLCMLDHEKLKKLVLATFPNTLGFHPADHCPNCGAENKAKLPESMQTPVYSCKCTPAERAMAKSDCTVGQCIRILMMAEIEKRLPSVMVD